MTDPVPTPPKPEEPTERTPQVQPLAPAPRYCAVCRIYGPPKGPCPKCGRSVLCG